MSGIRNEIKRYFNEGDAMARLIIINLGVFLLYYLVQIFAYFFQAQFHAYLIDWIALPSDLGKLLTRPWTLITYMFTHQGFLHILFNMLYLYFFGRVYLQYLGGRKLLSTYLLGGIAGGILYVLAYNVFPVFSESVAGSNNRGASAAVMAIVVAVATYVPNLEVRLFFTLRVKLWVVAALFVLMDLLYLPDGNNVGGHLAHLGGAALGYFSIKQLRAGKDITEGFSKFMDNIANWFKPKANVRKVYTNTGKRRTRNDDEYHTRKAGQQMKMDEILDKISRSGYESLTKDEKDYLFRIGKD